MQHANSKYFNQLCDKCDIDVLNTGLDVSIKISSLINPGDYIKKEIENAKKELKSIDKKEIEIVKNELKNIEKKVDTLNNNNLLKSNNSPTNNEKEIDNELEKKMNEDIKNEFMFMSALEDDY